MDGFADHLSIYYQRRAYAAEEVAEHLREQLDALTYQVAALRLALLTPSDPPKPA